MVSSRPRAPSWQSIFRILALLSHLVSRTRARTKRVVKPQSTDLYHNEHGAKQMMPPVLAPADIGVSYFNELDAGYRLDETMCTDGRLPPRLEVAPIQYGPPAPRWIVSG